MALAAPTVLYSINGGAPIALAPNANVGMIAGVVLTLRLQSTVGVQACTYAIRAPGTILDGQSFTPPTLVQTIDLPPTPTVLVLTATVTDGSNTSVSVGTFTVTALGPGNTALATQFGAKGDTTSVAAGAVVTGTPDEVALQQALDFSTVTSTALSGLQVKLNATSFVFQNQAIANVTGYRIRCPLQMNDASFGVGNITTVFQGEAAAQSGLVAFDFLGPAVVVGNAGVAGGNQPEPVLDPSGSGEWLMAVGPLITNITIAAGSNNVALPTGTINVNATVGMPPAGKFAIAISGQNPAIIHYTGLTSTSFTGCTGGSGTMLTGQSVVPPIRPFWNLGDSPTLNNLSGVSSFTWEYFVNPGNLRAWIASQGGAMNASVFGCEGHVGDSTAPVTTHQTMLERYLNLGASNYMEFRLTTTNTQYIVNSNTAVDQLPPDNTLTHVAIQYNHAAQTLDMFIAGQQPFSGMHLTGLLGSMSQQVYEMISIGSGQNTQWPMLPGLGGITIPPVMLGRQRLSIVARYTSGPFTPPAPSTVVCDSSTRYFADFDPNTVKTFPSGYQSPSIPTRPGLRGGYTIAQSGNNRIGTFGGAAGFPCWMYTRSIGTQYAAASKVKSMMIDGWGEGVHTFASLNAEIGEDCTFITLENPIIIDNFSFNSGIGSGVVFQQCGASGVSGMSAEVYIGNGSQFTFMKDRHQSQFGSCLYGVVATSGDVKMGKSYLTNYTQGVMAFVASVADVVVEASTLDDGGTPYALCVCLWAPNLVSGSRFKYLGGFLAVDISTCPIVLIGQYDAPVSFYASVLGDGSHKNPLFSFQGRAAAGLGNPVVPAVCYGPQKNISSFIDASNPGPVQVQPFIDAAPLTITPTANAGIVMGVSGYTSLPGTQAPKLSDQMYSRVIITTGGWTGTQSVTWPANPYGMPLHVHNKNAQTANLTRVGSSSPVACATTVTVDVWDNGTDLVTA